MPISLEDGSLILLEDGVDVVLLESEIQAPSLPPGNEYGFIIGVGGMMYRRGGDD